MDYEQGLEQLKPLLRGTGREHDFQIYEARLKENLYREQLHGTTEQIRSDRSQIIAQLNRLARQVGTDFNDLCLSLQTPPSNLEQTRDEHNDSKREQTAPYPPPQLPQLKLKGIQQITQLDREGSGVTALAFSPDNQFLVSGDKRGRVEIWEVAKKTSLILNYSISANIIPSAMMYFSYGRVALSNPVTSLIFHPGGKTFVAGWRNGVIKFLKCPTGETIKQDMTAHRKGIEALAISPDGLIIISAGWASRSGGKPGFFSAESLHWWEYPRTDEPIVAENYLYISKFRHDNCSGETNSIAFSLKGHFFAAGESIPTEQTGRIRIWDIYQEKERLSLKNATDSWDRFRNIIYHPNENLIAAINAESQCLIWDISTGTIQNTLIPLLGKITAIAFSPDGSHLAAGHSSGIIGFWSSSSGELLHSFQAHNQSISALVYNSDGSNLISGSLDTTIKVWGNRN